MSWLLPSNRRLRHLEGISLRNLVLSPANLRKQLKSTDDDSIPTTLNTPAKLLAQREIQKLEHSKSSTDLRQQAEEAITESNGTATGISHNSPARPSQASMRRRSTLNWASESSAARQKLLEDAALERRLDSFFSLHRIGARHSDPPLYISEIKECSMNPDFKYFSLFGLGSITRDDGVVVKVWVKARSASQPMLLIEMDVHLGSLVRLGKTLDTFYHPLPENCIVFHMTDGAYTSFLEMANTHGVLDYLRPQPQTPRTSLFPPRPTSSFDSLMKLKNLAECVDDALRTRALVAEQIESMITEHKSTSDTVGLAKAAQTSAAVAQDAMAQTRRAVAKIQEEHSARREDLARRRSTLVERYEAQESAAKALNADEEIMHGRAEKHKGLMDEIRGQQRRICQQLLDIFPIEPIEGKLLCFTIRGLFLPNAKLFETDASFSSDEEESTAAALGFVAQVVSSLETTLEIALPYPITVRGSTSEIFDPLSPARELGSSVRLAPGEVPTRENSLFRIFPLHQRGMPPKRFKCAVYLLNKNIEELMSKHSLKVMDPRNTLANTKYLLTVLASGVGEMPQRKKGDIRGLEFDLTVRTRDFGRSIVENGKGEEAQQEEARSPGS